MQSSKLSHYPQTCEGANPGLYQCCLTGKQPNLCQRPLRLGSEGHSSVSDGCKQKKSRAAALEEAVTPHLVPATASVLWTTRCGEFRFAPTESRHDSEGTRGHAELPEGSGEKREDGRALRRARGVPTQRSQLPHRDRSAGQQRERGKRDKSGTGTCMTYFTKSTRQLAQNHLAVNITRPEEAEVTEIPTKTTQTSGFQNTGTFFLAIFQSARTAACFLSLFFFFRHS